jgi:hypothetical protein
MLVVDPWHWLNEDGSLPTQDLRLRRNVLRVVQFIEAGGPLPKLHARETLLPCRRRPGGKPCLGLMWVAKTEEDDIHAFCLACHTDEAMIHNWQETEWAEGPMEPAPVKMFEAEPPVDPLTVN